MLRYLIPLFLLPLCSLFAKSSVWKVSKGGESLYIGGTCHLLRSSDYPLPPEFELAYDQSDTLAFEMNPAVINDPDFVFQLLKASVDFVTNPTAHLPSPRPSRRRAG